MTIILCKAVALRQWTYFEERILGELFNVKHCPAGPQSSGQRKVLPSVTIEIRQKTILKISLQTNNKQARKTFMLKGQGSESSHCNFSL